ncbi:DNA-binding protein [Candidatus Desulfarcum epimagneticum]|uniref:DNA-binding protein n=1 Tax=uncultured Desulfobacteraceae bacterium TaxID=218296 RepID=A0A484HJX2_9BACT|nr:DNA-binding protein [uncultured Desulfobacteraceae bacterium]
MPPKNRSLVVQETEIHITTKNKEDYICITDMLKAKDGDFFITDWLRNRNTLEFLSVWEKINNSNFNYGEFAIIKTRSGLNNFKISVKEWVKQTNAIGVFAKAGRYGGTFAHKDIAFEFGSWLSPEFKLYLIKEFQRLKEQEISSEHIEWDIKRTLTKAHYRIHSDAVSKYLVPPQISNIQAGHIYASEADLLNTALFGKTARQWRAKNPKKKGNIRDYATVEQLVVLASLESQNALLIEQGMEQINRIEILNKLARKQMLLLIENSSIKKLQ